MNAFFVERTECPACQASDLVEIYRQEYGSEVLQQYLTEFYSQQGSCDFTKLEGASFVLSKCAQCTCVFQKEIPNEKLLFELYEVWLDPKRTFELFEMSYGIDYYLAYLKDIYRYLRLFTKKPGQLKFFDFGMGWGNWLIAARAFGVSVSGSELSPQRTAHATKLGIQNIPYEEIPSHTFDFINADQVFEHLSSPLPILRHLARALDPAGFLRIAVPNGNNIEDLLQINDWKAGKRSKHSLNAVAPLEHINCFSTKALIALAAQAGLKQVALPDYPRLRETNPSRPLREAASLVKRTGKSALKPLLGPVYKKIKGQDPQSSGTDLLFQRVNPARTFPSRIMSLGRIWRDP